MHANNKFLQHLYIHGLQTLISRFVAVLCKDLSMVLTKPIVNFYQHETVFEEAQYQRVDGRLFPVL